MTATVTFGVLGPLEVRRVGQVVPASGRATRTLLGVLLLTPGEEVGEGRLTELVWGPAGASRGALHTSMSRLRTWLRVNLGLDDPIRHADDHYRLDVPAETVDMARFQIMVKLSADDTDGNARLAHLQSALDEWRGPALADAPERVRADAWVRSLEKSRAECACKLADAALQQGRPEVALPRLEQLAGSFPYDEPLHARIVALLGACGRPAEGLRLFEAVRARLADELGIDPSPQLRDAHLALPRSDRESATTVGPEMPPVGPTFVRGARELPAELPPDVATFIGRRSELDRLHELLTTGDASTVPVSAVAGTGGVGKSALAIHAAHRLAGDFPDGQLYINLLGATAGLAPLDPGDVLVRWLRSLGDTRPVADSDEAANRFRSAVSNRRMLIVLDNAADATQVRLLLPAAPSCAVLVTSRQPLATLDGATHLHLDTLPPDEAQALLARAVGTARVAAEPDATTRIAQLCGHLPLALRIAAARLVARPQWPLAALADRLADERGRLDELAHADLEVRASVAISYRALDAPAQHALRLLGLLQAPNFAAWVAAALLDSPLRVAEDIIGRLADSQLLEVTGCDDTGQPRYAFHDLIRLYARERTATEESAEHAHTALARAFGCWLDLAGRADDRLACSFTRIADGDAQRWSLPPETAAELTASPIAWFEAELSALVAAVAQSADLEMSRLACELANALTPFLKTRVYLNEWAQCGQWAYDAARRTENRRGEATALVSLGEVHRFRWRMDQAAACHEAALAAFTDLRDGQGRAVALVSVAAVRLYQGRAEQARQHAREAIVLSPDDPRTRARALRLQGHTHVRERRFALAEQCFEESFRIAREAGRRFVDGEALALLGWVLLEQDRPGEAVPTLVRALRILEQAGDRFSWVTARRSLGEALLRSGSRDEAQPLLEEGLSMFRESGEVAQQASTLRCLADLYDDQERDEAASACRREALSLEARLR